MLNSFYLVFIVLIIYSQHVSIFMKQLCRTHEVIHVKLELTTFTLQHDALPLRSCHRTYHRGPKAN